MDGNLWMTPCLVNNCNKSDNPRKHWRMCVGQQKVLRS